MLKFKEFLNEEHDLEDKSVHGKTFYRGSNNGAEGNPTGLYATSDKDQAKGYSLPSGQVTSHKVKPTAKILNIDHPGAIHKLYDNVPASYVHDARSAIGTFGSLGAEHNDGFGDHDGGTMRANLAKHGYHGAASSVGGAHRIFVFHGHHE